MDFVEQIFGIAPDGGSGLLELLFFSIPLVGLAIMWGRSRFRHGRRELTP